jgi:hypothetical protein
MNQTVSILFNETVNTESALDLVIENGKVWKQHYYKRVFDDKKEVDLFIEHLVIDLNYIMDKHSSDRAEFIDLQTGKIRYVIWTNNTIEKYYKEYLGEIQVDNSLLSFSLANYITSINH